MDIVIHRTGSIETYKPTILSYADGILIEDDRIDWSEIKTKGLLYSRWCVDTGPDARVPVSLLEDIIIIDPAELDDIRMVVVDGQPLLMRNLDTDTLDMVLDSGVERGLKRYTEGLHGEENASFEESEDYSESEFLGSVEDVQN